MRYPAWILYLRWMYCTYERTNTNERFVPAESYISDMRHMRVDDGFVSRRRIPK